MNKSYLIAAILLTSATAVYLLTGSSQAEPKAWPEIDLNKYQGTWYEIARFDMFFERNCKCALANYNIQSDGTVKVNNTCVNTNTNKLTSVIGKAWVDTSDKTVKNSKLRVQFFWPFSAQYWIVNIEPVNYSWVVVSNSDRSYTWVLSRTKQLEQTLSDSLVDWLKNGGWDVSLLKFQDQSCVY